MFVGCLVNDCSALVGQKPNRCLFCWGTVRCRGVHTMALPPRCLLAIKTGRASQSSADALGHGWTSGPSSPSACARIMRMIAVTIAIRTATTTMPIMQYSW